MGQLEEHAAAAERFLASSRLLQDAGDDRGSAEMVWGAAMQAVHALHHRNREGHSHSIKVLERIIDAAGLSLLTTMRLRTGLTTTVRLHNYFYTGQLGDRDLASEMATGLDFVNETLQLAQAPA